MKPNKKITCGVLIAVAITLVFSLAYRPAKSATPSRVYHPGVRNVGWAYHETHRNDVSGLTLPSSTTNHKIRTTPK